MSDKIIQLNEDFIKHDLKDLVRSSVEEGHGKALICQTTNGTGNYHDSNL